VGCYRKVWIWDGLLHSPTHCAPWAVILRFTLRKLRWYRTNEDGCEKSRLSSPETTVYMGTIPIISTAIGIWTFSINYSSIHHAHYTYRSSFYLFSERNSTASPLKKIEYCLMPRDPASSTHKWDLERDFGEDSPPFTLCPTLRHGALIPALRLLITINPNFQLLRNLLAWIHLQSTALVKRSITAKIQASRGFKLVALWIQRPPRQTVVVGPGVSISRKVMFRCLA